MADLEFKWKCSAFSDLSNIELYRILQLRCEVFVMEQNCVYQDMDNKDLVAWHLSAWHEDRLVAYSRLLAPGISFPQHASIGRVLTSPAYRKRDLGKTLMRHSIQKITPLFGSVKIAISAQYYLKAFYESFGFKQFGEIYLEDNIQHITMLQGM